MKLILPKTFIEKSVIQSPLFFLQGPVQGGENWQERCCLEITRHLDNFFVVVPCRWGESSRFFSYSIEGRLDVFQRQTAWEHHYLNLACELGKNRKGCIIVWLPVESKKFPRSDGQPYARDTYGEIGRWGRNCALSGSNFVVGAEPDFPGLSQIKENLRLDFNGIVDFPVSVTLEETVKRAVSLIQT